MRSICLYFQVHQPFRLRTFRFFDIGSDHNYYDDFQNRYIIRRIAEKCYLPTNKILLGLIRELKGAFKVSFSISGTALDQFEMYAPEVLNSFKELASTGHVEFLAETYGHSLSSLKNKEEFFRQVDLHRRKIKELFGQEPKAFRNTELVYSDEIGEMVYEMGFKVMLAEGAKHILGWKSPNYLYYNSFNPKLKVLLRNFRLSDDIAFRFSHKSWSEWPLTTDKFVSWLNEFEEKQPIVNIFVDYETFGEHQWEETGIFEFLKELPSKVLEKTNFGFGTPTSIAESFQPVAPIHVPYPASWADEERDLTAWLGNELQDEAFNSLYNLTARIRKCNDPQIQNDWLYLQSSDHFYYMCTKWFSDGEVHKYFNPYPTPYEAFINYMNVLSDFIIRVEKHIEVNGDSSDSSEDFSEIIEKQFDAVVETGRSLAGKARKFGLQLKQSLDVDHDKVITFDDLGKYSDAQLKKLFKNIDIQTTYTALKEAGVELEERVLPNLTQKAKKEFEILKAAAIKTSKKEIAKSRDAIVAQLNKIGK